MNDVARRWVEALRSGEYRQRQGYLRAPRGGDEALEYCCLGVLCEIQGYEWKFDKSVGAWSVQDDELLGGKPYWTVSHPPDGALRAAGIDPASVADFIEWNDGAELTFDQIADEVERLAP